MAKAAVVAVLAALPLVAAMGVGGAPAPAQQCDSSRLAGCAPAFLFGLTPWESLCCDKLREEEQKGCLCVYARDPLFNGCLLGLFHSPNARKALAACGVAYPTGC
jgi:hypothetical protein